MRFDSYTDCGVDLAVDLVNTDCSRHGELLADEAALRDFLAAHDVSGVGEIDPGVLKAVRTLRRRLRAVFEAPDEGEAARLVNALLAETQVLPQLTDHDGHWHLHYVPAERPLVTRLAVETAMGLATILRLAGWQRIRSCADATCSDVFVDVSRNNSRRFCSPRCANRVNVARWRADKRAGSA